MADPAAQVCGDVIPVLRKQGICRVLKWHETNITIKIAHKTTCDNSAFIYQ
jgi:hypothetical protein